MKGPETPPDNLNLMPLQEAPDSDKESANQESKDEIPSVDSETGIYTDKEGRGWTTIRTLSKILGVSTTAIDARIESVDSIHGENKLGRTVNLFSIDKVKEALASLMELPKVDSDTGIYTDPEGRKWTTAKTLSKKTGLGYETIRSRVSEIESIQGRDNGGKIADLLSMDEAEKELSKIKDLPQADPETGIYTDAEGRKWATANVLSENLSINEQTVRRYAENIEKIKGRNSTGKIVDLFPADKMGKELSEFKDLPKVDSDTGIYTDPEGRKWATVETLSENLGVDRGAINMRVKDTERINGRSRTGHVVNLFPLDEVEKNLSEFKTTPKVDKETGIYTDPEGRKWTTVKILSTNLAVSEPIVKSYIENIEKIRGMDRAGNVTDLFPILEAEKELARIKDLPKVDPDTGIYTDSEGKRWATINSLSKTLGASRYAVNTRTENIEKINGRDGAGKIADLFLIDEIEKKLANLKNLPQIDPETGIYTDGEGRRWTSINHLSEKLGVGITTIRSRISEVESIQGRSKGGNTVDLFPLDEVEKNLFEFQNLPQVDPDTGIYTDSEGKRWATINSLSEIFEVGSRTLQKYIQNIEPLKGRDRINSSANLFPIDEVEKNIFEFQNLPQADPETGIYTDAEGKRWATITTLSRISGISQNIVDKYAEKIEQIKGRDMSGRIGNLFPIDELERELAKIKDLPQADPETGIYTDAEGRKWTTIRTLSDEIGLAYDTIKSRISEVESISGRSRSGGMVELFRIDEVKKILNETMGQKLENREVLELENQLTEFALETADGKTPEAAKFRGLIGLFGAANVSDILLFHHPQYSKIPIETVKKILGEYLGDTLRTRGEFRLDFLQDSGEFLSKAEFRTALAEVMKNDCLRYFREEKASGKFENDQEIITGYFSDIKSKTGDMQTEGLAEVIDTVEAYYGRVLNGFDKPARIIDGINPNRPFPDINQLVNIEELKEKKKMLIADEMGLGKSASTILAKESMGIKQALVVVPANVIETWKSYLSDQISPEGKSVGYFRPGEAPSVLVVDSLENLQKEDITSHEYIIISQERLSPEYVELLGKLPNEMIIVDEVHKLKNIGEGKRANSMVDLMKSIENKDSYLALLSGTPVPDKVQDIAVYMKLLYPEKFADVDSKELVSQIINGDILDLRNLLVPRMQMKSVAESIDMPKLTEHVEKYKLEPFEREIYEILLEEDELTPSSKMAMLQKLLLNPKFVDGTPDVPNGKIEFVKNELEEVFKKHDKVVMFVNRFAEGVTRGEFSITSQLDLTKNGIKTEVIDGETPTEERVRIQNDLNAGSEKMLLVASGQVADVGVDFSGAEHVLFYNEPWTLYNEKQQLARVYRPGLKNDLESKVIIGEGTIEEGIHQYIKTKYEAVEKLLKGIPISKIEEEMLKKEEYEKTEDLESNPELARYYLSASQKMNRFFGYTKEIGEQEFSRFLTGHGEAYAEGYAATESIGFQANASRVSSTILLNLIKEGQVESPKILDIASGPEMLRSQMDEKHQDSVFSLDFNKHHFSQKGGDKAVGSFTALPFKDESFEFANLSLALHYSKLVPSQGEFERIEVMQEINRVLKIGGKAVINLPYSLDFKNRERIPELARTLGFKVIDDYSGKATSSNYESNFLTLEKTDEVEGDAISIAQLLGKDGLDALKLKNTDKDSLKDSKRVIKDVVLGGKKLDIPLNARNREIAEEQEKIIQEGNALKQQYNGIEKIPKDRIIDNGFARINTGKRYVLFKKLSKGSGYAEVR